MRLPLRTTGSLAQSTLRGEHFDVSRPIAPRTFIDFEATLGTVARPFACLVSPRHPRIRDPGLSLGRGLRKFTWTFPNCRSSLRRRLPRPTPRHIHPLLRQEPAKLYISKTVIPRKKKERVDFFVFRRSRIPSCVQRIHIIRGTIAEAGNY
jgi:hypothetical protein